MKGKNSVLIIMMILILLLFCPVTVFSLIFTAVPFEASGPPGATISWGYEISNEEGDYADYWIEPFSLEASSLTDIALDQNQNPLILQTYLFSPIGPDSISTSTENGDGLYQLTWDIHANVGSQLGTFILAFNVWDSFDPDTGFSGLEENDTIETPFQATVTTAVPEPTTLVLFVIGLVGVAGLSKRRKKLKGLS